MRAVESGDHLVCPAGRRSASATSVSGPEFTTVTGPGDDRIARTSSRAAPPSVGTDGHGVAGSGRTARSMTGSMKLKKSGKALTPARSPSDDGTFERPSFASSQRACEQARPCGREAGDLNRDGAEIDAAAPGCLTELGERRDSVEIAVGNCDVRWWAGGSACVARGNDDGECSGSEEEPDAGYLSLRERQSHLASRSPRLPAQLESARFYAADVGAVYPREYWRRLLATPDWSAPSQHVMSKRIQRLTVTLSGQVRHLCDRRPER